MCLRETATLKDLKLKYLLIGTLFKAKVFIKQSLDRHFGSRKKWNFKTGSTKQFTSQVVDRINAKPSPLCFME